MTVLTRASNHQSVSLGKQIASSGEGEVWETNLSGILAKIYHNPTPERIEKLKAMLANPPADPMACQNHISIAFPQDLLKNQAGAYVGFLMPAIRQSKELPSVYHPKLRKRNAPGFNWYYLHATALNVAWIIQEIHAKGYVLGDIKPQNILVNDSALVAVIDTDSFQVRDNNTGKVYRCTVGSEGFTPIELLGKDFSATDQIEVHDRFRLAVLIHYLLFGYHPFSGQWIGSGESPEQTDLIRRGFWPYSQNSLIRASLNTISLDVVHPELKRCFLKCFNDGHATPNLRPTAEDWHKALQVAVNELIACDKVDSHNYSRNYGKCYWCERKALLGVDIFPGGSVTATASTAQPSSSRASSTAAKTTTTRSTATQTVPYSPQSSRNSKQPTSQPLNNSPPTVTPPLQSSPSIIASVTYNSQIKQTSFPQKHQQLFQVFKTVFLTFSKYKKQFLIGSAIILVGFAGTQISGYVTSYLKAEAERKHIQEQRELATSEIEEYITGIGIRLEVDKNKIPTINNVFENSPAFQEGVKIGDQLLAVDGKSTANVNLENVVSLLGGEVGTQVTLQIARPGSNELNFTLTRSRLRNPNLAKAFFNRGVARSRLGDNQGAIEDYNQAIRLNPNLPSTYVNRGNARSNLGDNQGAIEDYNQAIHLNSNLAKAFFNRGVARSKLGDTQGAIEDYNQAIRLNPNLSSTYVNRGNARSNLGDNQGAIEDYNQAIRLNPNLAKAYLKRGIIRYKLGDNQGSNEDIQKSASLGNQTAIDVIRNAKQ